jgi:hypothetical protein
MKTPMALGVLVVCIACILYTTARVERLVDSLAVSRKEDGQVLWESIAVLKQLARDLAGERTRLERGTAELAACLGGKVASDPAATPADTVTEPSAGEAAPVAADAPYPPQIVCLEANELHALEERRDQIDPRPSDQVLILGDEDTVISDPAWNPTGRDLSDEERSTLEKLIDEYRYFQRLSIMDRHKTMMRPEKDRLLAIGAYVEYDPKEGPPPVPERNGRPVMTLTAPSDHVGLRRVFYYYPEDFPDLYHWQQVESERSLERYVQIYELLNGGTPDGGS